jgi:RNA polymerase sigma-70 factor (ECF subfamily)
VIETNETLLNRLRTVEAHVAWREFFDLYAGAVIRYARKAGLDEHQAQDALQETMLALMRALPEFRYDPERGRFRSFLLTIVHRKAVSIQRRARRQTHVPFDEEGHEDGPEVAGPKAEKRWREAIFEEALVDLRERGDVEPRTWAVFDAYVLRNRPVDVVATENAMVPNAVYQIKNRLTRRLKADIARRLRDSGEVG